MDEDAVCRRNENGGNDKEAHERSVNDERPRNNVYKEKTRERES